MQLQWNPEQKKIIWMIALRKVGKDKVWNLGDFFKKSKNNTKKS